MKFLMDGVIMFLLLWLFFRNTKVLSERIVGTIFLSMGAIFLFLYEKGFLGVGVPSLILYLLGKAGFMV